MVYLARLDRNTVLLRNQFIGDKGNQILPLLLLDGISGWNSCSWCCCCCCCCLPCSSAAYRGIAGNLLLLFLFSTTDDTVISSFYSTAAVLMIILQISAPFFPWPSVNGRFCLGILLLHQQMDALVMNGNLKIKYKYKY